MRPIKIKRSVTSLTLLFGQRRAMPTDIGTEVYSYSNPKGLPYKGIYRAFYKGKEVFDNSIYTTSREAFEAILRRWNDITDSTWVFDLDTLS